MSEGAALVARNNERAAELIRGFKQIAVDQSSDEWREIDLRDYVDETLASLRPRLRNSPVEVSNAVEAGLTLYTHPGAIYQIVSNLVLNALSHAYAEGQAGRVEIAARRDGDEVALECRDDGGGIAPEHLGRVFEPFFTTRLGQGGSGLGLSIVYNLVTGTLRGRIEVDSAPDAGTRFRIRFPVQVPAP
ncbi:MAG: HAMP domain-containing histidine kinase [Thiobacillaceae bacterium]|nr:HAMP domain-containing histidine kinase [Thiobacillaceae bacterium]